MTDIPFSLLVPLFAGVGFFLGWIARGAVHRSHAAYLAEALDLIDEQADRIAELEGRDPDSLSAERG